MQHSTQLEIIHSRPSVLSTIGSVENVLSGIVPDDLKERWWDAESFAYAFEIGSVQGIDDLGEMVAFNGMAYCKSTDGFVMQCGSELVTTGALIIPTELEPSFRLTQTCNLSADKLYAAILDEVGKPFACAGVMQFTHLEGWAVTAPPIQGEKMLELPQKYYAATPLSLDDVTCAVVGAVADLGKVSQTLQPDLHKIFYAAPNKPLEGVVSHTHLALLNTSKQSLAEVTSEDVVDVLHLFPHSRLSAVALDIFPIDSLNTRA